MKCTAALLSFLLATACAAAPPPAVPAAPPGALKGEVLEARNVESYTYLRLKTATGETWAAVPTTDAKKGEQVTIVNPMTMDNFDSKSLGKHFDHIVFGQVGGAAVAATAPAAPPAALPGAPSGTSPGLPPTAALQGLRPAPAPHGAMAQDAVAPAPIKVAKATGPGAKTVADIVKGRAALKDKTVLVRGQVVKVNTGIMGKTWVHLRDGSGAAADGSNDLLVTTHDEVAVGDVVSAKGTVRTDVEIGAGYAYAVLIEDAALRK